MPMQGLSKEEARKKFDSYAEKAKEVLRDKGICDVEIIDSFIDLGDGATALDYLIESLKLLKTADIFCQCHEASEECTRGCYIEHQVWKEYMQPSANSLYFSI